MKLIFCMQISMKVSYKLILWFLMGMVKHFRSSQNSKFAMSYNISKKTLEMKFIFCMQINIKVSYNLISTLWVSKLPTSLQYLYNNCLPQVLPGPLLNTLSHLCKGKGMNFINNNNIDSTCLSWSKLHMNKSGTSLLYKHFSKVMNSVWLTNENDNGEVHNIANSSIVSFSKLSRLRNLRSFKHKFYTQ